MVIYFLFSFCVFTANTVILGDPLDKGISSLLGNPQINSIQIGIRISSTVQSKHSALSKSLTKSFLLHDHFRSGIEIRWNNRISNKLQLLKSLVLHWNNDSSCFLFSFTFVEGVRDTYGKRIVSRRWKSGRLLTNANLSVEFWMELFFIPRTTRNWSCSRRRMVAI